MSLLSNFYLSIGIIDVDGDIYGYYSKVGRSRDYQNDLSDYIEQNYFNKDDKACCFVMFLFAVTKFGALNLSNAPSAKETLRDYLAHLTVFEEIV